MEKPYNIIPPQDAYRIDIDYPCTSEDECPPYRAKHVIENTGAYTFYLNGEIQYQYIDFGLITGTEIGLYVTYDKVHLI